MRFARERSDYPEISMSRVVTRPYLIAKDADGAFRVTVRTTRLNSQGYPLVSSTLLDDTFKTATAARAFVKQEYKGLSTDIATK
jgi:hypothetical protein